jgi:hypothetical protein
VDNLLFDLNLAEKWHCPPWEVSGRKPERYRIIYRYLEVLQSEAQAKLAKEKQVVDSRNRKRNRG